MSTSPLQPRIALVVIAKNEARGIERCLRSAQPWVDAMIVLDTGSTDRTADLAASCGAQVHSFQWVDDFSAARNAALSKSDATWNLILDGDEWLAEGGECLSDWTSGEDPFIGVINVSSSFQSGGKPSVAVNWISRLLPRGVRYCGRIHEQPQSSLPRKRIPLLVGHDGYEPAHLESKRGRNAALLRIELEKDPENAYLLYQLGKDFEAYQHFPQACVYYQRAWERVTPGDGFVHSLVTRKMYCMSQCGQLEEAIVFGTSEMDHWQHSPDFFFVMGNLLLDLAVAQPARAMGELLPLAASFWERCLEIGEAPLLDDSVPGRGSYLAQQNLTIVRNGMQGTTMSKS